MQTEGRSGQFEVAASQSLRCTDHSPPRISTVKKRFYPEAAAGGFSRVDGTIEFYSRVNALLNLQMTVLNFGAGRGAAAVDDPVDYRRRLRNLRGKVRSVIGIDVDPVVLQNPKLDDAKVISADELLPLPDASIEMVVSDWTFEHLEHPGFVAHELTRVIKPGGWICARTPNRWGYAALGAQLVPEYWHNCLLRIMQPERKSIDVFRTYYRLNTKKMVRRYFPYDLWSHHVYVHNPEPAYFANSTLWWWFMITILKVVPEYFGTTLMIFLQRRDDRATRVRCEGGIGPPSLPPETDFVSGGR